MQQPNDWYTDPVIFGTVKTAWVSEQPFQSHPPAKCNSPPINYVQRHSLGHYSQGLLSTALRNGEAAEVFRPLLSTAPADWNDFSLQRDEYRRLANSSLERRSRRSRWKSQSLCPRTRSLHRQPASRRDETSRHDSVAD